MKVRIISNGSEFMVQRKRWYLPFWRKVDTELNHSTPVYTFSSQDPAIKLAAKLLKPKPKKPKWSVVLPHRDVVEKIERCVHAD